MPRTKKAKRKSKLPARLQEFLCEDNIEKEQTEPRRSRRVPKISDRLKCYMDGKDGVTKQEDGKQVSRHEKKSPQNTASPRHHLLLGSKYMEPKVVLKVIPKSLLPKGTRCPVYKGTRVSVKRVGNTSNRNSKVKHTLRQHKKKAGVTKASKNSQAVPLPKKELKVTLEDIYSDTERPSQNRREKCKTPSLKQEPLSEEESSPMNPGSAEEEKEDSRFDQDVMEKLFNFGAKVKEVLDLNDKAIDELTNSDTAQSLSQMVSDKLEDIDDSDTDGILKWLEEEECKRKEHRIKLLESLRVSHNINIALYSHMLHVLQSVTGSV